MLKIRPTAKPLLRRPRGVRDNIRMDVREIRVKGRELDGMSLRKRELS